MKPSRMSFVLVAAIVSTAGLVNWLYAGDLNPPAGPVSPTMKPLDQVEPRTAITATNTPGTATAVFRITQPGSYYLVGNVTGVASKSGIEIVASDVTLDLSGFRMTGVAGSLAGIVVTSTQSNLTIRNGTVRGWAGGGINASTDLDCTIEGISAIGNTGQGIQLGAGAIVRACHAVSNTQSGILTSTDAIVSDCVCRSNGQTGVTTNDHSIVTGSVIQGNTGAGLSLGAGNLVAHDITAQNAIGISASSGLHAVDTLARDNNSHGFFCFGGLFANCQSTANTGDGFNTDTAELTGCRSTANSGNGFMMGSNSMLVHSLAVSNSLFGAHANSGYLLRNLMGQNSLNQSELREIKFDTRGRADGNHLNSFNSLEWGLGGPAGALFIMNSLNGGFVTTFGGTEGPDIDSSTIGTSSSPHGNYDLP